jgi:hypothetical protein
VSVCSCDSTHYTPAGGAKCSLFCRYTPRAALLLSCLCLPRTRARSLSLSILRARSLNLSLSLYLARGLSLSLSLSVSVSVSASLARAVSFSLSRALSLFIPRQHSLFHLHDRSLNRVITTAPNPHVEARAHAPPTSATAARAQAGATACANDIILLKIAPSSSSPSGLSSMSSLTSPCRTWYDDAVFFIARMPLRMASPHPNSCFNQCRTKMCKTHDNSSVTWQTNVRALV